MKQTDPDRYCKACGADWLDKPIPLEDREFFGGSTHFSRRISLYDRNFDRTTAYKCPDCGDVKKRMKD